MQRLLAIETATDVCSVALLVNERLVTVSEVLRPRAHARHLVPLVQEVLRYEDLRAADLDAVAVSEGPGSFTGLRIGVSTAKGLAFAAGAALVGVPSLEALAAPAAAFVDADDVIVAAFASRRGEAYVAAYRRVDDRLVPAAEASALWLDDIAAWLPPAHGDVWIAGEAASLVADALPIETRTLDATVVRPRAEMVGRLGWVRWQAGSTQDVASFEPAYMKAFEARRGSSIFERLPQ